MFLEMFILVVCSGDAVMFFLFVQLILYIIYHIAMCYMMGCLFVDVMFVIPSSRPPDFFMIKLSLRFRTVTFSKSNLAASIFS